MVKNLHLRELLDIEDVQSRTAALRRAFAAYTEPLDVTGEESSALIILLNLTYPKKIVDDLLDKRLARTTVNNQSHIDVCIEEVQWLHTHNLKYPDIRVSKQKLVVPSPQKHPSILSSANCQRTLGWSHDSAKVNFAKLFGCHFIWQGKVTCLATLMCEAPTHLKEAFQELGMLVKDFMNVCGRVKRFLPEELSPDRVDKYSIQVRIPYRDSYIAITPVVSHAVQSELQQTAIKKQGRYTSLEFIRPAAVSELAASLGGNVKALNYPPRINKKTYRLSDNLLARVLSGQDVLNLNVLSQRRFIKALDELLSSSSALALKQRRQQKVSCLKQIREILSEWLAPMLEWRFEVQEGPRNFSELEPINGSLEYQFLTFENELLPELLMPLFGRLNSVMSHSATISQYAFHQRLMPYLRNSLKWLLTHLAYKEPLLQKDAEDEHFQRYLHLKGIRVFDAQALSNPYCVGIPSLTAVWGMMHNYQRRLNEGLGTQLRLTSFSWFIRQYSSVSGKKLPEFGMQGAKENQFRRAGIIDNRHCDLVFDLVIHIDGYEDDLAILDNQTEMLKASFPVNFAGGVMHPPELDAVGAWCQLYQSEAELFSTLKRLPMSGKWIMPTRYSMGNISDLLFLLDKNSSLCPTMVGYLPLTEPVSRVGSLEPLHCYAEPALGVVECASAIEIRLQGQINYFKRAFWMLEAKEHSMLMKRI